MNKISKKIVQVVAYCYTLSALVFLQACQDEFLPEPMGEPIPSSEYPELAEVLESEGYGLFKAAWERSNIEEIIAVSAPRNRLTFLIPTDEAMTAGGYSQIEVASADPTELDSLIAYHILNEETTVEQVEAQVSYQAFSSILTHAEHKEGINANVTAVQAIPYRYLHYIDKSDLDFLINGTTVEIEKEIPVTNGNMLVINKVLQRPKKQMIDVLREDGRFNLFLKSINLNVEIYDDFVVNNFMEPQYVGYRYLVDHNYITKGMIPPSSYAVPHIVRFTLFAPTDEAFHQFGITSEDDLDRINKRIRNYSYVYDTSTSLDSLLRYHRIGEANNLLDIDWDLFLPSSVLQQAKNANNAVFYVNRLNNANLGEYEIILPANNRGAKKLEHDFGKDATGHVTVKHNGAPTEPATIIEENINTIQGPIHVVDRLIIPKDFSMWHVK